MRILTMLTLLSVLSFTGCATVTPGTVVLEVPVCDGADRQVLRQGRYWPAFSYCTNYYDIVSREQRQVWSKSSQEGSTVDESLTFAGKDGQAVNCDVGIGYVIAERDVDVLTMVTTFGYDLDSTIHSRVRDSVRNGLNMCASTMTVDEIYGQRKEELFTCAELKVQEEYNSKGLVITRLTLNSEVRLPAQVKSAMEASTAATQDAQRVEREVASAEAEGKKTVATARAAAEARLAGAEAEAKSNQIVSDSLTPQLLELKRLEIEKSRAERWDGKLPVVSGGQSTSMILDVGQVAAVNK
jgi:regulator of protease activity HflC (stomatin/prohibitin superfamily)